ncbi:MAG: uracil-DNA glycosylase family protein [Bacilli bacterium]
MMKIKHNPLTLIDKEIREDPLNLAYTKAGINPIYQVDAEASIVLIGQAPGLKAQQNGIPFLDLSGDRLRIWLGVDKEAFYDNKQFAILPMDFYFPGSGKHGDLPPRPFFAQKYHARILNELHNIKLIILIGQYAQHYYLKAYQTLSLTEIVKENGRLPAPYFALPHPSPRNNIWLKKNPWFEEDILPELKDRVKEVLLNL